MTMTDDLWRIYGEQLLKQAAPNFDPKTQQFSLASSTLSVDLGNADPAVVNGYIYNIGNTIPTDSPSYAPGSALYSSFDVFLDSIDLKGNPNPNLDSQINLANTALTNAQNNFTGLQTKAIAAWNAAKAIDPAITFTNFVNQQYQVYNAALSTLNAATSQFQGLMVQKYGKGYALIQAARNNMSALTGAGNMSAQNTFNMAVKAGSVAPPGSVATLPGQDPPVPANALQQYYLPSFALQGFTAQYAQWQANSANGTGNAVSLHVDSTATVNNWSNFGYSASAQAEFSYDFFSATVQTSAQKDTQTSFQTNDNFSLDIDFVGLNSFTIAPGLWFDDGILNTYKNQLLAGSPPFFASNGSLARLPYQALIGFQPTLTLQMSHSDYTSLSSQFKSQTTVSFGFGPFVIGHGSFSNYADKSAVTFNDANTTIVISPPPSTVPILLGILSTRLDV